MSKRFIPIAKRTKKAQREHNLKQRKSWGGLSPVTRKPPNPKAYSRKKTRHTTEE